MEEIKLSDDVFEQIKDFDHKCLKEKQELLIGKLILNEELKKRYKEHGLCKECKQPNTGGKWNGYWCQSCNAERFQQNFKNWTSGNHDVDEFIQNTQINAKTCKEVLEWIEYNRFETVEYLTKGGFGSIHKAIWKDGSIRKWVSKNDQWERDDRKDYRTVVLECLHNSQDTVEFLREIESHLITNDSSDIVRCYGITKDPETNSIMMVIEIKYDLCEECRQPNTGYEWCQSCNAKRFQQNFQNWTSGNNDVDKFIQNAQIKAINSWNVLEWIEYNRFELVEYLNKGEFGTVYKANWKDVFIEYWDSENNSKVILKCLHNPQDTVEFLREVESHLITNDSSDVVYGITKDSETNCFMMVIDYYAFKKYYIKHGVCKECKHSNTGGFLWCQSCNANRLQQNFKNWTSNNHDIDEFIQNAQLKPINYRNVLEWIEYDRFENVEFLAKSELGTVYKTIWKDGWVSESDQWERVGNSKVVLKCLHNSQDTVEFLREIESHLIMNNSSNVVRCYGITKDPETNSFMMVIEYDAFKKYYIKYGVCEECKQPITSSFCWCQSCNAQHFQQNFKNWTSKDCGIDEFIQNAQLKARSYWNVLEWIEYDNFENIEYVAESEYEDIYKAIWKNGYIYCWDSKSNQWERYKEYYKKGQPVALKCLHDSQNITIEFLKEIESHFTKSGSHCYGITKHPKTNNFMMVFSMEEIKFSDDVFEQIKDYHQDLTEEQELFIDKLILNKELNKRYKEYGLCKECKQLNTGYECCQSCNAKRFQQNFKNWTSENNDVDEFIQIAQIQAQTYREVLEWIEYNRFENIEYLAEGGFGFVYRAIWKDGYIRYWDSDNDRWERCNGCQVVLKCLHYSQGITVEFLEETEKHLMMSNASFVVRCYGITKDPETNNFIMVMEYADNGNLRQHLNNQFNLLNFNEKIEILYCIANGLEEIHNKGLIHRDFHCGNILSHYYTEIAITDLGLCRPANVKPFQSGDKKIYGVLPYVAPEVLKGKEYTQASDIYAFGIIAYEVCTGLPPYYDVAHEEFLAIRICHGLRPKSNYAIPQQILDIIKLCWDADPSRRPKAEELWDLLKNSCENADNENSLIYKQIKEANMINMQLSSAEMTSSAIGNLIYTTHPQAIYTSRLLDFKNLPVPKNADNLNNSLEAEYSESTAIDFTKLNSKDGGPRKKRKIDE